MQRMKIQAVQLITGDTVVGHMNRSVEWQGVSAIEMIPINTHRHDLTGEMFAVKAEAPTQTIMVHHIMIMAKMGTMDVYETTEELATVFDIQAEVHAHSHAEGEGHPTSVPHIVGEDPGLDPYQPQPEGA